MHITAMSSEQHRPVRQVLARVPRQEGPHHRRARQRRRLDRVLHHRQARAEDDRPQRAARHGAVPLPGLGHHRPDRGADQRVQRLRRRGVPRALQGAQARHRHRRAVVGRPGRHPQRPDARSTTARSSSRTTRSTTTRASGSSRTTASIPTSCSTTTRRRRRPGRDVQLEKAIEVLLKQIKEKPFTWPPVPAYPKR